MFGYIKSLWDYPRVGHSLEEIERRNKPPRGNGTVYERLGGKLSPEDRQRYMDAASGKLPDGTPKNLVDRVKHSVRGVFERIGRV